MTEIQFVVEQAGCASCAALVEDALTPLGQVRAVEVDEAADAATVTMMSSTRLTQEAVDESLAQASVGAAHLYRVQPGSWTE